ncbi:T9SS type A sorting domain-containing protein [bacterium]|nr:T9SS type A sorting domain-containing protein [bacterium]
MIRYGSLRRLPLLLSLAFMLPFSVVAEEVENGVSVLYHLVDESIYPDHVLQEGETATLQFSMANLTEPWTNVDWGLSLEQSGPVSAQTSSGTIDEVQAGDERTVFLSIPLTTGDLGNLPDRTAASLTIDSQSGGMTYSFHLSLRKAEVLLISDGMENVREVIAPALEAGHIVWGYAGVPMNELPHEMYEAWTIMVEADARYSQYLFTPDDVPVRDWFRYSNGGSLSGLYLYETYPYGDPEWLGGLASVWNDPLDETTFLGYEDDPIARGQTIEACSSDGVSISYPCCGNPAIFHTGDGIPAAGWFDYGWRVVDYGFSLVHMDNGADIELPRDELIRRTANWLVYRETSVFEPIEEPALPVKIELVAYPNPFNASLTIELRGDGRLSPVEIINANGRLVETLFPASTNSTQLSWNAQAYPSGTYYVKTATPNGATVRKVTLLK